MDGDGNNPVPLYTYVCAVAGNKEYPSPPNTHHLFTQPGTGFGWIREDFANRFALHPHQIYITSER